MGAYRSGIRAVGITMPDGGGIHPISSVVDHFGGCFSDALSPLDDKPVAGRCSLSYLKNVYRSNKRS